MDNAAAVALIWPGVGVGWFGMSGNPDDALAGLSFARQRTAYQATPILPLLLLVGVGVLFYVLGRETRQEVVTVSGHGHMAFSLA
ncbi:MAG: amino acid permease [Chloroflexi bacterium]|jgi:hypothetical protein|nr:amino acid permease [Chloroflexota bacterium]